MRSIPHRLRVLPLLLLLSAGLRAQCVISTQLTNSSGCPTMADYYVNTTGGTAPFTIVVDRHVVALNQWLPEITVTNDADGDYGDYYSDYGTDQLRVTVTDALGCIATQTNTFQAYALVGSYIDGTIYDVCTGTTRVRVVPAGTNCPLTWLATQQLIVDGVNVGPVQLTCTFDGTGWWVGQPFTNGPHTVNFSGMACFGNVIECWVETSFSVNNPYSGDCGVNFHVRAALDGALPSGTIMNDALRSANLVPTLQPYTALGYAFVGSPTNVTVAPSLLAVTGNDAIVDWLVVEVRNPTAPYAVVYSKPALLQRDGDVIDADGNPYVNAPISPGNYRIALRHRNHLGVMTGTSYALVLDPDVIMVDLRLTNTSTYGVNARVLKNGVQCLWAGDTNGDGILKYTGAVNDRDPILLAVGGATPTNTLSNVYDRRDANMDGIVRYTGMNNDRDIILLNIGGTVPTATRTQQLP